MDNLSHIEALFFTALDRGSPGERATYLDEACAGDPELRRRVERLLCAHAEAGSFLEQAPLAAPPEEPPDREGPGTTVGPYKLLEKIGEGGMGRVFLAEQDVPIRRRVALKIIKPGLDSAQVLARFEAERQALALMDHPNVARVLDAGTTDRGLPYFVMELIHGVPITDYCSQHRLSLRQRLELFVPVCQAVQHAHQKGIIHRDLTPSNVLVASYDGKAVPKVIDFGVARATAQRLTERTLVTGFGALVGTLEYMSPEQAEINALDIDTRSDVYSLGVLLYKLLTGQTPLDRRRLKGAGLLELLRRVREEEPAKPSDSLRSSPELPALAEQRGLEPARLTRLVRGELDWIVMKCLEKDRGRRYQTAAGLAEDLQCHLADEPLRAAPPSTGYRLRKLLKRRRKPLLAAGALVALLAGLIGATLLGLHLHRSRADLLAETLRMEGERAELQAQTLRIEGERHARQLDKALRAWEQCDVATAERILDEVGPAYQQTWEQRHLRWLCSRVHRLTPCFGPSESPGDSEVWRPLAFSADGHLLAATVSSRKRIKVCELMTGQEKLTLATHLTFVEKLSFSSDGRRIAAAGVCGPVPQERFVEVFDVATGQRFLSLRTPSLDSQQGVDTLAFSGDGHYLVVRSYFGPGSVWDTRSGREVLALGGRLTSAAFSADSKRIATRNAEGTVKVWSLARGQEVFTLPGPLGDVSRESFSPDGNRLALIADGIGKVFDATEEGDEWQRTPRPGFNREMNLAAGRVHATIKCSDSPLVRLLFSSDRSLTGLTLDGQMKQVNPIDGQVWISVKEAGGVERVVASPDGSRLALVGPPGFHGVQRVRLWSPTGLGDQRIELPKQTALGVVFTGNVAHILTNAAEGWRVWDGGGQAGWAVTDHFLNRVSTVAFSPDGQLLSAGVHQNNVKLLDARTGQERKTFAVEHSHAIDSMCFSPDSRRLTAATSDRVLRVWDLQTGEEVLTLRGHTDKLLRVSWSLNGQRIVSSSRDGTIRIWDAETGQEQLSIPLPLRGNCHLAISPDGSSVIRPGQYEYDKQKTTMRPVSLPEVIDAATGKVKLTLRGAPDEMTCAAFSPDGHRIVMGGMDGTVRVWDAATGEEQLVLKGHTGWVWCVAFSPDGQRIVSGGRARHEPGEPEHPGEMKLWDAVTGLEKLSFKGHTGWVYSVAFSPDGQRIVSSDGAARVWEAPETDPQVQR